MKRKYLWAALVVIAVSLAPATYRSIIWAADANGLLVVASLTDEEHTANPYSRDGLFVSPDLAAWVLLNFDFPYGRCSRLSRKTDVCDGSLIAAVGASLDEGNPEAQDRLYRLLHHFIDRGMSVNARDPAGVPLVHQAILFNNPQYLKILIDAGAELSTTTKNGSSDAFEFARRLAEKDPSRFAEVINVLNEARERRPMHLRAE